MPKSLFAERFLVSPVGPEPPEPAGYDEELGISVTDDGSPFIEAGANIGTRTFTEAEGESGDEDHAADASALGTRTATFVDAEGVDTDKDIYERHDAAFAGPVAALLSTITRADGERPDATAWAHTRSSAPGEPPDHNAEPWAGTRTLAQGEAPDYNAGPWAHTKGAPPGEPVDHDAAMLLATVTKAAGEAAD